MPETPSMSIEEATRAITAPGQLFEMEDVEIRGVPTRVWKNCPDNLRVVLELSRGHGDADYLVYEDERTTYEEHFRTAAAIAGELRSRFGIELGDRVAIAMRNLPEWAMAFWGAAVAGGVVVPLNAWWTSPELHYGLADSGTKVAFVDAARLDRVTPHLAELPDLRAVVVTHEDRTEVPALPHAPVPVVSFAELVGTPAADVTLPAITIDPEDDATIFYTSGTTGKPKGAVGTHRNMGTNLMSLFFLNTRAGLRSPTKRAPRDDDSGGPGAYLLSVP
ncbi:MAG: AMP-binding protein, partial [Acidimicrobiales bacterium]|nr:AMP-binding protein [Acidimicrobiales bacterium]